MKFVVDITLQPGVDPDEFADTFLDWLTCNGEAQDLIDNGLQSFDGVDPVKSGRTIRG